jgi:NAD(P)H-hydrate epimerase
MPKLYKTEQIRAIESQIMQHVAEWDLMQKAADAVYRFIRRYYPSPSHYVCVIGGGNNGGDALTVAALLKTAGKFVDVRMVIPRDRLTGSAARAAEKAEFSGLSLKPFDEQEALLANAVIIDGLVGIGLSAPCREPILSAIHWINRQPCPVVSIDLPSGLNADTGCAMGAAVHANYTVTLIGAKIGLYMADGPDHAGEIHVANLNEDDFLASYPAIADTLPLTDYGFLARKRNVHKGHFGHVLIIGGNEGMAGAVAMASLAAMRTGAGLVSAVVRRANMTAVLPVVPEAMVYGIDDANIPKALLEKATVLVVGPGLGEDDWAKGCFSQALQANKTMLIDASALHLLADMKHYQSSQMVLTPHPGEAGKLLGISASEVQSDRLAYAQKIQSQYGGVCVLKGVGTLICDGHGIHVCQHGNPGMASAGMGDVLSGIIAALLAQGMDISRASQYGVLLHAIAGDEAAKHYGEVSMIARDVIDRIPACINRL